MSRKITSVCGPWQHFKMVSSPIVYIILYLFRKLDRQNADARRDPSMITRSSHTLCSARRLFTMHKYTTIRFDTIFWRRQTVSLESAPMDDTNAPAEEGTGSEKYILNVRKNARFAYNYWPVVYYVQYYNMWCTLCGVRMCV